MRNATIINDADAKAAEAESECEFHIVQYILGDRSSMTHKCIVCGKYLGGG